MQRSLRNLQPLPLPGKPNTCTGNSDSFVQSNYNFVPNRLPTSEKPFTKCNKNSIWEYRFTEFNVLDTTGAAGSYSKQRVIPSGSICNQRLFYPCSSAFMTGAPSNRYCCWPENNNKTPHHPLRGMPTIFRALPAKRRLSSSLHAANLFAFLMAAPRLLFSGLSISSKLPSDLFLQSVPLKLLDPQTDEMHTKRLAYLERSDERSWLACLKIAVSKAHPFATVSKTSSHSSLVTLVTAISTQCR